MRHIIAIALFISSFNAFAQNCNDFKVKVRSDGEISYFDTIQGALDAADDKYKIGLDLDSLIHGGDRYRILLGSGHFPEVVKISNFEDLVLKSNCEASVEGINILYSDRIKVKGIKVDGDNVNKDGIRIRGQANFIKIKNVEIRNAGKDGINIDNAVKRVFIQDSLIKDNGGNGIFIKKNTQGKHKIEGVVIEQNTKNGILTGENKLRILSSTISNNGQGGNKKQGYGLARNSNSNINPRRVLVRNSIFLNNNGKIDNNSTIDIKKIDLIADVKDTGNQTTSGTEFPQAGILPVAVVTEDLKVNVGALVNLDGSKSFNPSEEKLSYNWRIIQKPNGSNSILTNIEGPLAKIEIDTEGTYKFGLKVVSGNQVSIEEVIWVSTDNVRPVAITNENQKISTGVAYNLLGENSFDNDGDNLTYSWSIKDKPQGSSVSILSPNSENTELTPDVLGRYEISLVVNDGANDSREKIIILSSLNIEPKALANLDFKSTLGDALELNASETFDLEGDSLNYRWTLLHSPDESMNEIDNTEIGVTHITPDFNGIYVFQVIANDNTVDSQPYIFKVEVRNTPPTAGIEINSSLIETNTNGTLFGNNSNDVNGDDLTFIWKVLEKPVGSNFNITNSDPIISFTPDLSGTYRVQLTVNDGFDNSIPQEITFKANFKPTLNLIGDASKKLGELANLSASATDQDGEILSYSWSIVNRPSGSLAPVGVQAIQTNAVIIGDLEGIYTVRVNVTDGNFSVNNDYNINFTKRINTPPVLNDISPQAVMIGNKLSFNLAGTDPEGDDIVFQISPQPYPRGFMLNAKTGEVTFSPDRDSVGTNNFTVTLSDGVYSTSKSLSINVMGTPAGTPTSMQGRVLDTSSHIGGNLVPIVGATVSIVGQGVSAITDSNGYFTLNNIPVTTAVLYIDTSNANDAPDGSKYANFGEGISFIDGAANIHNRPFYLPRVDGSSITPYNPSENTTVTNPNLNVSAEIPVSTNVTNPDGTAFSGSISISEVPEGVAPVAMPQNLQPGLLLTIQPAGIRFDEPVAITFPNVDNLHPGTIVDIWSVNIDTGMFESVGKAQVTPDGTKLLTIEGGIRAATWHTAGSAGVSGGDGSPPPPPPCDSACGCPVVASRFDLVTGSLHEEHELVSYKTMNVDRSLTFSYNSQTTLLRPIVTLDLTIPITNAVPNFVGNKVYINGVDQGFEALTDTKTLSEDQDENFVNRLQIDASNLETGYYNTRINTMSIYDVGKFGIDTARQISHVNHRQSAFGNGWGIEELEKLHFQSNGDVFLVNGKGKTSLYAFDSNNINEFISPRGEQSTLTKNSDHYIKKLVNQTEYFFDLSGKLLKIRDMKGNTTSFRYSLDLLTEVIDPTGKKTVLEYVGDKISKVTDPMGRETLFSIDNEGNLVSIIDPDSSIREFNYGNNGLMTSQKDKEGNLNSYLYDSYGLIQSSVRADGTTRSSSLLSKFGLASTSSFQNNLRKKGSFIADPVAKKENEKMEFIRGNGAVETHKVDDLGLPTIHTSAEGHVHETQRDDEGNVIKEIDGDGTVTNRVFDSAGNLLTESIEGTSEISTYEYNENNLLILSTDPRGNSTAYQYNEKGDLVQRLLPDNTYTRYIHNSKGQLIKLIDFNKGVTQMYYSPLHGNLVKIVDPERKVVSYTHDAAGNTSSITDGNGETTSMNYDLMNKVTVSEDAKGHETFFGYNNQGDLLTLKDARGNTTIFEVDSDSRITKRTDPAGRFEAFVYNNEGRVSEKITKNGDVISFRYNLDGKIIRREHADDIVEYKYSSDGNLIEATNKNGTVKNTYGASNGRLQKVILTDIFRGAEEFEFNYVYTDENLISEVTDSRGNTTKYSFTKLNQIEKIDLPNGQSIFTGYDDLQRRTGFIFQNGTFRQNSYSNNNELLRVFNAKLHNGENIYSVNYGYEKAGNIEYRDFQNNLPITKIHSFGYDETSQLIEAINPFTGSLNDYELDELGNRLSTNGNSFRNVFDKQNRIVEDSKNTYEHDSNGNLTLLQNKSTNEVTRLFWDADNKLIEISTHLDQTSPALKTVEYMYGPLGRRLAKSINGSIVENYIYSGDNIYIAEGISGERLYIHSDEIDKPLAMRKDNKYYSIHTDNLGSVLALVDENQQIVDQYAYGEYGETHSYNKDGVEVSLDGTNLKNIFGYTGREIDSESSFYYYRARYYVPALGRFLSSDPIGFGGGDTNLYRYVGNNPIRYNDPSGLKYRTCKRKLNGAPGMAGPFYHEYIDFDSGSDYSFAPADGEGLFNSTSQNKSENPGNDSCGEWSKDSSNDKMIRDKARQNMTKDYNLNSYNCQDFVGDTLNGF
jgi:RHS repeat-associated protein